MVFHNLTINTEKQTNRRFALRLLPLLLLFLLSFAVPQKGYSQSFNPLISFSVESCTLDQALEKLFADYEINVAFSKAEMSKIQIEKYACSYKSVEEVLTDLLKGTDYGFKKIGKQYVIRKNQVLVNDPAAVVTPPAEQQIVVFKPEPGVVPSKTADTIYIIDSVKIIRTAMRHDTVVKVEYERITDTVYEVKYEGWKFFRPHFQDTGWFINPHVTMAAPSFRHVNAIPETEDVTVDIIPSSAFAVGVDGGYKFNRLSVGASLAYRSARYRFMFEKLEVSGGYYVNDTLDTYYTVYPSGDTTYQYVLDSTYVPQAITAYAYRDVNRLSYLNVGVFASYDFFKSEYIRAFVKAGVSLDVLVGYAGSFIASATPYHTAIERSQVQPVRFSYYGGLGAAFKVANSLELVPEVHYRVTTGSLYRVDYPFDLKMRAFDFRLGLTYYF